MEGPWGLGWLCTNKADTPSEKMALATWAWGLNSFLKCTEQSSQLTTSTLDEVSACTMVFASSRAGKAA